MDDLVILQKIYDMILWATPIVENYPRSKRFTLGTYTQNAMLELLKCVIEANKLRYRQRDPKQRTARIEAIRRADVQLALLTYYVRLAAETKAPHPVISRRQWEQWSQRTTEIGRMIGGWLKST